MGWLLGPARPAGPVVRGLRRLSSPRVYLKLAMAVTLGGLVLVPTVADLVNAAMRPIESDRGPCRVIRVLDGDTVSMICAEEGMVSARIVGFDTPDLYAPRCVGEFFAAERASWALRTLIQRAERLQLTHQGTDKYGRALVVLRVNGVDVAREMIRAGHGRPYGGGPRGTWCE